MKYSKTAKHVIAAMLACILVVPLCGCGGGSASETADCFNGKFVGQYEEPGVLSFKGIPYAKPPVNELRWKAPESVEQSSKTIKADEFGDSAIQYYWFSEPITTEVSENCLTLNIWTKDLETTDKPVMVYIHGGSGAWGGSSEEIYDGRYIVDRHNDVIVVSVNYRLGMMGFIDLSSVPGGEEFGDSRELGLLDCTEALRWVRNNIRAFGGNPDNVTIFGESTGAAIVSCLLAGDNAGELFNRAIIQSGNLRITYSPEDFANSAMTDTLLAVSGAKNMDDLMNLSTEELIEINERPLDEDETCINDLYNAPLRGGKVTKEDAYSAVSAAAEKGVDLLIGTNADEVNYWIEEMNDRPISELSEEEVAENLYLFENYYIASALERNRKYFTPEHLQKTEEYLETRPEEELWAKSKLETELIYHVPAIKMAEYHSASSNGKTYMYLFEKKNDNLSYFGSCHAAELPYVFHNLQNTTYGTIDAKLADDVCDAWVNFARCGDPGSESFTWMEYDTVNRYTTAIGNDGKFSIVSDPEKTARELLDWVITEGIHPEGD